MEHVANLNCFSSGFCSRKKVKELKSYNKCKFKISNVFDIFYSLIRSCYCFKTLDTSHNSIIVLNDKIKNLSGTKEKIPWFVMKGRCKLEIRSE